MLLLAGLILLLAGSSWFTGAATVGLILLIAGLLECGWYLFILLLTLGIIGKVGKDLRRSEFAPPPRRVRSRRLH